MNGGRVNGGSVNGVNASSNGVVTIVPGYVATPLTAGNRYGMPFLLQPHEFAAQQDAQNNV